MDPILESHFNFEHAGQEASLEDTCELCRNFVEGAHEVAPTLGVNLSDEPSTADVFGRI